MIAPFGTTCPRLRSALALTLLLSLLGGCGKAVPEGSSPNTKATLTPPEIEAAPEGFSLNTEVTLTPPEVKTLQDKANYFSDFSDRQKALEMGEDLAMSAIYNGLGKADKCRHWYLISQLLADQLDAGMVPPPFEFEKGLAGATHYILVKSKVVSDALEGKGKQVSAAFQLGMRLQLLPLVFEPGGIEEEESLTKTALRAIGGFALRAGLDQEFLAYQLPKLAKAPSREILAEVIKTFRVKSHLELG